MTIFRSWRMFDAESAWPVRVADDIYLSVRALDVRPGKIDRLVGMGLNNRVGMTVETADTADADAITSLWRSCDLLRPWNDPLHDIALALGKESSSVLVIRDGGAIVASVMVGFDGHRGWVYYLGVAPERRGQGLARRMMAAAEDWLKARGAPKIQLMVREDNEGAIGFYYSLGFEQQKVVTLGRFLDVRHAELDSASGAAAASATDPDFRQDDG